MAKSDENAAVNLARAGISLKADPYHCPSAFPHYFL
jgi:hypothetical protein